MPITARRLIALLKRKGFYVISQTGSHVKLRNPKTNATVIVPFHNGDIKKGLEIEIRKQADLERKDK